MVRCLNNSKKYTIEMTPSFVSLSLHSPVAHYIIFFVRTENLVLERERETKESKKKRHGEKKWMNNFVVVRFVFSISYSVCVWSGHSKWYERMVLSKSRLVISTGRPPYLPDSFLFPIFRYTLTKCTSWEYWQSKIVTATTKTKTREKFRMLIIHRERLASPSNLYDRPLKHRLQ